MGDHTETVQIEYDPDVTSYSKMLDIFWANHNPTSKCSRQYMSAIFYHSNEQKQLAEESLKVQQNKRAQKVTTKILPIGTFTDAEDYHQKYLLQRHPKILNDLDMDPGDELNKSFVATRLNGYVGGYGNLASFEKEKQILNLPPKVEKYVAQIIAKGKSHW
jgi:peptide-methionine (S)-S-oxide reductase